MSAFSGLHPVSSRGLEISTVLSELEIPADLGCWNRLVFSRIGSTNLVGKQFARFCLATGSGPRPTVLMALEQTAGRGRLDREWISPPGGIYATLVTSCDSLVSISHLPLGVATTLCRELDGIVDPPCRLKWPNDLMVEGRKLGGILIESVKQGDRAAVVAGFGVNYSQESSITVADSVSVLELSSQAPLLGDLASRLVGAVAMALSQSSSIAETVEEYSRWSLHERGDAMCCHTPSGTYSGTFAGFDSRGLLKLRTQTGDLTISVGDLIEDTEVGHHV